MMMFKDKYDRAKKWQLEQKQKREEGRTDTGYELSPEDLMEKGDMLAMMVSGVLTILIRSLFGFLSRQARHCLSGTFFSFT